MTETLRGKRPEVLMSVPYYLPGYRAGGPIRTVSAMVEGLDVEFRFRVLTSDRDEGDEAPYPEARPGEWVQQGRARVRYLAPEEQTLAGLRRALGHLSPDLLYLNSFYHPVFTFRLLLLRRLGALAQVPLLLAPRGHLSPGARAVKTWRKRAYIALVKLLGLVDDAVFHASDDLERREIREVFPDADVRVAPNMVPPLRGEGAGSAGDAPGADAGPAPPEVPAKEPGRLKVIYLSRVAPKKNLAGLLEALRSVSGRVELSVVGPIGDETYWAHCRQLIDELPASVEVDARGAVPHRDVPAVLAEHHLFALPTRSENFGHVIREALQVGRPVLISDRTPWTGLEEAGAGWMCRLEDLSCFGGQLQAAVVMNQEEFRDRCEAARRYVRKVREEGDARERNRRLLLRVAHGTGVPREPRTAGESIHSGGNTEL